MEIEMGLGKTMNLKPVLDICFAAVLGAVILAPAVALRSQAAFAIESDSDGAKDRLEDILKISETEAGRVYLGTLAQKMGLQTGELLDFLRTENGNEKSVAWGQLLGRVTPSAASKPTALDYQNADVLASSLGDYVRIRKAGIADDFELHVTDIAKIQDHWTLIQKMNFEKVLEKTAEISKSNSAGTTQDAFRKALSQLGYLEKFEAGCRK